jgi:pimeloyl-ACP methyl ester carboxylesterase
LKEPLVPGAAPYRRPLPAAALPWRALAALALALFGCAWPHAQALGSPAQPLPPEPAFEESACPFVVPWSMTITCGHLLVPEDRTDPTSATLELFVAILRSRGTPSADPVVVLPGGPGGSALELRTHLYPLTLRDHRDVILMDPRGAGTSTPSLECFELSSPGQRGAQPADAFTACALRLQAEGRNLGAYTSAESVEDVADLAQVLGLKQINLLATSYGTRVAMLLAERHPQLVRSMALDSVLPPWVNPLLEQPVTTWRLFRALARECAADVACNRAFPDLYNRLLELVDRYNGAPLPDDLGYGSGDDLLRLLVKVLAQGGERFPAFITALHSSDFAAACALIPSEAGCFFGGAAAPTPALQQPADGAPADGAPADGAPADGAPAEWRDLFMHPEAPEGPDAERITFLMHEVGAESLTALLAELDAMEVDDVQQLLARMPQPSLDAFSEGAFASVLCAEDAPRADARAVAAVASWAPTQLRSLSVDYAREVEAICAAWNVPPAPHTGMRTRLQTPTLLLSGSHEPVTPPLWAHRAAAAIDDSVLASFPGYGHALLTSDAPCLDELLAAFFTDPEHAQRPACLADLRVQWAGLPE